MFALSCPELADGVVPCGGLGLRDLRRPALLAVEGGAGSGAGGGRGARPEGARVGNEADPLGGRGARLRLCPLSALSDVTLPSTWLGLLRDTALCGLLSGPERRHQRRRQSSLRGPPGLPGPPASSLPRHRSAPGLAAAGCNWGGPGGRSRRRSGLGRQPAAALGATRSRLWGPASA